MNDEPIACVVGIHDVLCWHKSTTSHRQYLGLYDQHFCQIRILVFTNFIDNYFIFKAIEILPQNKVRVRDLIGRFIISSIVSIFHVQGILLLHNKVLIRYLKTTFLCDRVYIISELCTRTLILTYLGPVQLILSIPILSF